MATLRTEHGSIRFLQKRLTRLANLQLIEPHFRAAANNTLVLAQSLAPRRTGGLVRSGYVQIHPRRNVGPFQYHQADIGFRAPHAILQEKGVLRAGNPYVIKPKGDYPLRWIASKDASKFGISAGDVVERKSVLHPGFPAHPFLFPAARKEFRRFNALVPRLIRSSIRP